MPKQDPETTWPQVLHQSPETSEQLSDEQRELVVRATLRLALPGTSQFMPAVPGQ